MHYFQTREEYEVWLSSQQDKDLITAPKCNVILMHYIPGFYRAELILKKFGYKHHRKIGYIKFKDY